MGRVVSGAVVVSALGACGAKQGRFDWLASLAEETQRQIDEHRAAAAVEVPVTDVTSVDVETPVEPRREPSGPDDPSAPGGSHHLGPLWIRDLRVAPPPTEPLELSVLAHCGGGLVSVTENGHALVRLSDDAAVVQPITVPGIRPDEEVEGLACAPGGARAVVLTEALAGGHLHLVDGAFGKHLADRDISTDLGTHRGADPSGWEAIAWLDEKTMVAFEERSTSDGRNGAGWAAYDVTSGAFVEVAAGRIGLPVGWRVSDATVGPHGELLVLEVKLDETLGASPTLRVAVGSVAEIRSGKLVLRDTPPVVLPANDDRDCRVSWSGRCINPEGMAVEADRLVFVTDDKAGQRISRTRRLDVPLSEVLGVAPPTPPTPPTAAAPRLPDAFFDYSSSRAPTLAQIQSLAACRVGGDPARHVLVGVDAGNPEHVAVVTSAKATVPGVRLHLYVEGPGGVTGDTGWSADECRRVKEAALSVQSTEEKGQFPVGDLGKNDCDGDAAWIARWRSTWWLDYTLRQIADASARGFESFEIDNLGTAQFRGAPVRGANLVAFYAHFQAWAAAQEAAPDGAASGRRLTILMKNLEPDELDLVAAAIRAGTLRRSGFSDFHVSERGSGNRKQQHAKSAAIGIQTIDSNDTYHYTATGPYRVVGEREGRDRGCVPTASR